VLCGNFDEFCFNGLWPRQLPPIFISRHKTGLAGLIKLTFMYQYEWFEDKVFEAEDQRSIPNFKSMVDINNIDSVLLLNWQEHCLECAPPLCYTSCALYLPRKDKKCRNIFYGIYRNKNFSGLLPFGADMRFKKWGKLETRLSEIGLTPGKINVTDKVNYGLSTAASVLANVLSPIDKKRKINGLYNVLSLKSINSLTVNKSSIYDDFLVECYSFEHKDFKLIIEYSGEGHSYRNSINIAPGQNFVEIPAANFKLNTSSKNGLLSVYPENDLEARVAFTWLDFVKYNKPAAAKSVSSKPAAKIKCIAWDLDNTLWHGVFIENKPSGLKLRPEATGMIKKLDEKGILQTVVSKNSYEEVWPHLESLGLAEYFLYPAINWGQKSENLKKIADLLNINIDTFGVIDDSVFEREEIKAALPQVRTYDEKNIDALLTLPEFDIPVTEESKKRRSYYLVEQQRNQIAESFSGDYVDFLKSCDIHLSIIRVEDPIVAKRCYELIQRTNQLNLSSRRYDPESFEKLMRDEKYLKYAFECYDKFGSYGIVGFSSIETGIDFYKIHDFVISCRVAQKMVEHAFITWLSQRMNANSINYLLAEYIKTTRNSPILAVFEDIQFEKENIGDDIYLLKLDVLKHRLENNIISVDEK